MSKKTSFCLTLLAIFLLQSPKTPYSSTLANKTAIMLSLPLNVSTSSVSLLMNSNLELTSEEEQNQSEELILNSLSNKNSENKFVPIHFLAKKSHDSHICRRYRIERYKKALAEIANGTNMKSREYRSLKKDKKLPDAYIDRYKEMGIDCGLHKDFKSITSSSQKTMVLTKRCIKSPKDFEKYSKEIKWTTIQKGHFEVEKFGLSCCPTTIRKKNAVGQLSRIYRDHLGLEEEINSRTFCDIKLRLFNNCVTIFVSCACILIFLHSVSLFSSASKEHDKSKYFYNSKNSNSKTEYGSQKNCTKWEKGNIPGCSNNFECDYDFKVPLSLESSLYLIFAGLLGMIIVECSTISLCTKCGHCRLDNAPPMELHNNRLYYKLPKKKPGDLWTAERCTNCGDSYWLKPAPEEKKPGCLSRCCNKISNYLKGLFHIRSIKPVEIEVPVLDLSVRNNDIVQDGEGENITYS